MLASNCKALRDDRRTPLVVGKYVWISLGGLFAVLAALGNRFLEALGNSLGALGGLLGTLGRSWGGLGPLGCSWACRGRSWGGLGSVMDAFWELWGPS